MSSLSVCHADKYVIPNLGKCQDAAIIFYGSSLTIAKVEHISVVFKIQLCYSKKIKHFLKFSINFCNGIFYIKKASSNLL